VVITESHTLRSSGSRACPAIVHPGTPLGPDRRPAPTHPDAHPLGCHRPRIADRIIFDKPIQVLVFGCGYRRIADHTCSATTLRRRRDEWIARGLAEQLRLIVLAAYDQLFGLELEHLAVDGCTTAPCGGQVAGAQPGRPPQTRPEAFGRGRRRCSPLATVPAPANQRDDGLLAATLDAIAVVGPLPPRPTVYLDAATTTNPADSFWPAASWWARSPAAGCPLRSRPAAAG
jgi:transposase